MIWEYVYIVFASLVCLIPIVAMVRQGGKPCQCSYHRRLQYERDRLDYERE